jgi:hypothetical protein
MSAPFSGATCRAGGERCRAVALQSRRRGSDVLPVFAACQEGQNRVLSCGFMLRWVTMMVGCLWLLPAGAQTTGKLPFSFKGVAANSHTSLTGQFVIRDLSDSNLYPIPFGNNPAVHYVRVDPTLLTVSCERIKHAFVTELGTTDKWQDKIYIDIRRARTLNDTVVVQADRYGRYWNYRVSMPDTLDQKRVVTTVVQLLLLEMANRHATQTVEVPPWLAHGITQDLMRSSQAELVLERAPPMPAGREFIIPSRDIQNTNALTYAHDLLKSQPPLTVEQLSWPEEAQLEGEAGEVFRSSSQLFVHELLQLKDGPTAMRAFVDELPEHLNWQLSFFHAFRADFGTQLDLEKWWALRVVDFSGRDFAQAWSIDESWNKLEEIIHPTVDVRTRANELPFRTQVSLQVIIQKWEVPRQVEFLKQRSQLLYSLRSRVSQEYAKLVDDYRKTIDKYLIRRSREGFLRSAKAMEVMGNDNVADTTLADLNLLDSIREDLRPKPRSLQSAIANRGTNP